MAANTRRGFLDVIEWLGNRLPDPSILFIGGTLLIMVLSHIGTVGGWSVAKVQLRAVTETVVDEAGNTLIRPIIDATTNRPKSEIVQLDETVRPRSLLTSDGIYWCIAGLIRNFINFPPLGIVITAMLGVGVAERSGLFDALLKLVARIVPPRLVTPTVIFLGMASHMASDAGYLVLPPLAAALYLAAGRSPLLGIANAFAGVAGGFAANFLISGTDALIAGITQPNAQILDPGYTVAATANWYFMAGSTVLLTVVGWALSSWFIEPRLSKRPPDEGGPQVAAAAGVDAALSADQVRGLRWALAAVVLMLGAILSLILIPGAPLSGMGPDAVTGKPVVRWVASVVPLVFAFFIAPGMAFGYSTGRFRSLNDVVATMVEAVKALAPIIQMSFFAAQFIAFFNESNLGKMLAIVGGRFLAEINAEPMVVIVLFIALVIVLDLLIASMSAKFALIAPIFVPMLMMLGLSPELTQCAYRVGDSVANIVSPMNSYLLVILVVMQRYVPKAGLGTLMSLMTPYSIVFAIVWTAFLLGWMWLGVPLGPGAPLWYAPLN